MKLPSSGRVPAGFACLHAPLRQTLGVSSQRHSDRGILCKMKLATGKVVGGKVVLDGASLQEVTSVTVLTKDDEGDSTGAPRRLPDTSAVLGKVLMSEQRKYWFPAKRYGWGWGFPAAWQGCVVIVVYVCLIGAGVTFISPSDEPALFVAWLVLLSLLLIAVCWARGEPPQWRWGKRDRV